MTDWHRQRRRQTDTEQTETDKDRETEERRDGRQRDGRALIKTEHDHTEGSRQADQQREISRTKQVNGELLGVSFPFQHTKAAEMKTDR